MEHNERRDCKDCGVGLSWETGYHGPPGWISDDNDSTGDPMCPETGEPHIPEPTSEEKYWDEQEGRLQARDYEAWANL